MSNKYRTLEEVVVNGVGVGANNDIELSEEQAAALEGKVVKLGENGEPETAAAPEAAPEATPEATSESTPEATPESTPEATPESTPVNPEENLG